MTNESETIEQVFERCTSTDFSSRDREEILRAMQEYADIQIDTYKKSLLSYLEHEQDGGSDDLEYKALQRVIEFINAKHIDNQLL